MPSAIMIATAMPTTSVGRSGSLRIIATTAGEAASAVDRRAPAAPHVDRHEQEQPDDVDEMPVPGGRLEAEMLARGEMPLAGPHQADDQEDRPDDDVEAVEAGRHEERRAVDISFE